MKSINCENPIQEIWQSLLRYSYIDVINNKWKTEGRKENNEIARLISSSIKQAESYYSSAAIAPINIQPLLLYYGSVSLLIGALTIIKQERFNIENHGMILDKNNLNITDILSIKVIPKSAKGALNIMMIELGGINDILNHGSWTLWELLICLPDLAPEIQATFPNQELNIVKVEVVNHDDRELERIELIGQNDGKRIIERIKINPKFNKIYLEPQITNKYIVLYRTLGGIPDWEYSIIGEKFLPIYFQSKGSIFLPQYLTYYMGLFILGTLSRYHPEIWDVFINYDNKGTKNLVNYFLQKSVRYFPNLILNIIEKERIQYN